MCIWVRSWNCGCLVTWFCYQLIAKPGNKTATVPWPDPYTYVCISKPASIDSDNGLSPIRRQAIIWTIVELLLIVFHWSLTWKYPTQWRTACLGLNILIFTHWGLNTLRPRQDGRHFADDTFNRIFLNDNVRISSKISLKFVPNGPINNSPSLVKIMAWRRSGDKPLSEPMMVSLLTHICVTRPQCVNKLATISADGIFK